MNWTWPLPVYNLLAGSCREFSCCQPTHPGPFPLGCFPTTLHPGCSTEGGGIVAKVQNPSLGLVECHAVGLSPQSRPYVLFLCLAPLPRPTLPPSLVLSASLLRLLSIPSSWLSVKVLNSSGPTLIPVGHHCWVDTKWMQHHSAPLSGPGHPASSWPSEQCTCPRHGHLFQELEKGWLWKERRERSGLWKSGRGWSVPWDGLQRLNIVILVAVNVSKNLQQILDWCFSCWWPALTCSLLLAHTLLP